MDRSVSKLSPLLEIYIYEASLDLLLAENPQEPGDFDPRDCFSELKGTVSYPDQLETDGGCL